MERDGVAVRIPVQFRSVAWDDTSSKPRPITLDAAEHNAIVLLSDDFMQEHRADWDGYVAELRSEIDTRGIRDVYIPFGSPSGERPLPTDAARNTHYARRDKWEVRLRDEEARTQRLLLLVVYSIRKHLRKLLGIEADEPLFVSHAKIDGDDVARDIVDYVNSSDNDVPLQTFYDAMELVPGDDFRQRFENEIGNGTLLAIVSDVYDSRPWCIYELTVAKRARRPIVLADIGKRRTSRTYPYGANLPRVRISPAPGDTDWIERLLVETLSEGLRCDIFLADATRHVTTPDGLVVLPRPPELFDLTEIADDQLLVIYPDPPLGLTEMQILDAARQRMHPKLEIKNLAMVRT